MKKKIAEITDQKQLKKSLGKMNSLVKFTKNRTVLNEKRIRNLKRLQGGSSLSPLLISRKRELYLPTRNSSRLNVPS